jgi:CBS domain-containing protein
MMKVSAIPCVPPVSGSEPISPAVNRYPREVSMKTANEIMTRDVITITPDMDIARAAQLLLEKRVNGVPVVDADGRLVGILCQSDLIIQQKRLPIPSLFTFLDGVFQWRSRHMEKEMHKIAALTVAEAMTPDPITVSPDTTLETVAGLMVDNNFHTLPVVENHRIVGIVGKEDVLRTLIAAS